MPTILTPLDFFYKEPILIEQAQENNGMPTDLFDRTIADFNSAGILYERRYLRNLLGSALHEEFLEKSDMPYWADLKKLLWIIEPPAGPQMAVNYSESPVADYIYFWYTNDHSAIYNGQVLRQAKVDSSITIQVVQKQIWIWERMKGNTLAAMNWLNTNYSKLEATAALDKTEWSKLLTNYNSFGI